MKILRLLLLSAACFLLLTACGDNKQEGDSSQAKETYKSTESNDELEIEKWNIYVGLSNLINNKIYEAVQKYVEAFGDDPQNFEKPVERDRISFNNAIINNEKINASLKETIEISAKKPQNDFDLAASALAGSLLPLWENMQAMQVYFNNKDYIDDDYAKARELHSNIANGINSLEETLIPFEQAIAANEEIMREKDLNSMRAKGYKILPATLDYLQAAQKITVYLDEKEIYEDTIQNLNLEEYRPLYGKLSQSLKELEALAEDKDQLKKENLSEYQFSNLLRSAQDVKVNAAALIENVQEKKKVDWSSKGTPENIGKAFNYLIDSYNRTIN